MTHHSHQLKRTPLQTLGERVRTARKQKELSQEKLAELTGMAVSYIGGIERGQCNPSFKKLIALAQALDCDVAVLTKGIVDEKKNAAT